MLGQAGAGQCSQSRAGDRVMSHTAMRCICRQGTQLVFSRDIDKMIRYCDVMYLYEEDAVGYSSNIDKAIR